MIFSTKCITGRPAEAKAKPGCALLKIPAKIPTCLGFNQSISQTDCFIVRLKVDQRAGQLSLLHLGITKTEKIELKHKTDEQISPVNGLEP